MRFFSSPRSILSTNQSQVNCQISFSKPPALSSSLSSSSLSLLSLSSEGEMKSDGAGKGGTIGGWQQTSDSTFSFDITLSSSTATFFPWYYLSVELPANSTSDSFGNPSLASNKIEFAYDPFPPAVRIATSADLSTSRSFSYDWAYPILVAFSEPVLDFGANDLEVEGGTVNCFKNVDFGLGRFYEASIGASKFGEVRVRILQGAVSDFFGNPNLESNTININHVHSSPSQDIPVIVISSFLAWTSFASASVSIFATVKESDPTSSPGIRIVSNRPFRAVSTPVVGAEPSRNLLRIFLHVQVFALSEHLACVKFLPAFYSQLAKGFRWTYYYAGLPMYDAFFKHRWRTVEYQPTSAPEIVNSSASGQNADVEFSSFSSFYEDFMRRNGMGNAPGACASIFESAQSNKSAASVSLSSQSKFSLPFGFFENGKLEKEATREKEESKRREKREEGGVETSENAIERGKKSRRRRKLLDSSASSPYFSDISIGETFARRIMIRKAGKVQPEATLLRRKILDYSITTASVPTDSSQNFSSVLIGEDTPGSPFLAYFSEFSTPEFPSLTSNETAYLTLWGNSFRTNFPNVKRNFDGLIEYASILFWFFVVFFALTAAQLLLQVSWKTFRLQWLYGVLDPPRMQLTLVATSLVGVSWACALMIQAATAFPPSSSPSSPPVFSLSPGSSLPKGEVSYLSLPIQHVSPSSSSLSFSSFVLGVLTLYIGPFLFLCIAFALIWVIVVQEQFARFFVREMTEPRSDTVFASLSRSFWKILNQKRLKGHWVTITPSQRHTLPRFGIFFEDFTVWGSQEYLGTLYDRLRLLYGVFEYFKMICVGLIIGLWKPSQVYSGDITSLSPSYLPSLLLLLLSSLNLLYLLILQPFTERGIQFVEGISVFSEVIMYGSFLVISSLTKREEGENAGGSSTRVDISSDWLNAIALGVLICVGVACLCQIINHWVALGQQVFRIIFPSDDDEKSQSEGDADSDEFMSDDDEISPDDLYR